MCKLFIGANEKLWNSSTRSLRIDGMVTSVRLENYFWHTLTEISSRDDLNIPQLLAKLYHESIDVGHDLGNFTSFLRVCCMRYLALQLNGNIPTDLSIPLATLSSDNILKNERQSVH
jgi:predicted DNA-binding ribbon-helix-helix protein